jgi:sucrose phosphorylase
MLALEGIPALYFHSLLGTENDYHRVEHTGRARSINRHIWSSNSLNEALNNKDSHHRYVFDQLLNLLQIRRKQPAFHPNTTQFTMHLGAKVFAFWRQSHDRRQSIFCLFNITAEEQIINLADINLISTDQWLDLITSADYSDPGGQLVLTPYQFAWISNISS